MRLSFMDAFRDRSVFLTGHTGFKGSWLALWLDRLGARVTGYSLGPPSEPNNFRSSQIGCVLARGYDGDVRDVTALQAALAACRPDVVLHLAAQALVRRGYLDPRATFEVNVIGTVNILQAVRSLERPCVVIIVTSDKCYDNSDGTQNHVETDPLGGNDPYSASKAAAEIVTAAYRKSFFFRGGLGHARREGRIGARRQCDWRRRLGRGSHRSRCAAGVRRRRSNRGSQSGRDTRVAACAGTAFRLFDAGSADAGERRRRAVQQLEFRAGG